MKRYNLILADPPWHFRNWSADAPGKVHDRERGANKHYPTDTLEVIKSHAPPTKDDALLFIWTISSHLDVTFDVIKSWGFEYKTIAWYWIKFTKDMRKPRMGGGYYTRQVGELCLLGTKGNPGRPKDMGVPGFIFTPRLTPHSKKPDQQYDKIDKLYPHFKTRLEMYARRNRTGWDVFGNEIKESIEIPSNADSRRLQN